MNLDSEGVCLVFRKHPNAPSWPTFECSARRRPPGLLSTKPCLQALADDIRWLCSLIQDCKVSNHDEWLQLSCILVGSESRSSVAKRASQKPREFVGEVSSFADQLFAKTDIPGVDVRDSLF